MNTNHLSDLKQASFVFVPIYALLFGASGFSFFLGVTQYDQCPFEPLLTKGLIGFGILGSICVILALIFTIVTFFYVDDSGNHLYYLIIAFMALVGYGLSAGGLASITGYMFYTKDVRDIRSFCSAAVYNFCCGFTVTVIVIYVLIFFIFFTQCCCKRLCQYSKKKRI